MTKTESYQMHKKDDLCRREKKKEGAAMYRAVSYTHLGKHEELLEKKGFYAQLYQSQFCNV